MNIKRHILNVNPWVNSSIDICSKVMEPMNILLAKTFSAKHAALMAVTADMTAIDARYWTMPINRIRSRS